MKNILAENLLRFGVKNLKDADKEVIRRLSEIAPAGSTMTPEAQAAMDKMIADTQALAKGAVGVTFPDGSDQPMKVVSASVRAVEPENWKLNGAIQLVLNTNYGGIAKSIKIGLLSDAAGTVKIVGSVGKLLPIDFNGIYQALLDYLGKAYKPTLDNSIKANPSPYKTLITVLTGIAEKYKSTGLAAPTRESKINEVNPAGSTGTFDQAAMDKQIAATKAIAEKYITSALKLDLKGGGPISVKNVTVYSRANMSVGGIAVSVAFNIKESGVDYSIDFPIYGDGPKANYMGAKNETSAKTYFDTSFPKLVGKYFATTGTNYDTCKQGIWNGIVAVTNAYNTAGVALK